MQSRTETAKKNTPIIRRHHIISGSTEYITFARDVMPRHISAPHTVAIYVTPVFFRR